MDFLLEFKDYLLHLFVLVGIYMIIAQAFNLTFGLGQLFNLAHVASYSLGAYATALLSIELNLGFQECILFSMLLSALFSIFIGAISLRLTQDYFAIGTLAFSSLVSALLVNWKSLTRGVLGIPGIPRPIFFGYELVETESFLLLVLVCLLISQIFLYICFQNSFGRGLRAQSEMNHAALAIAKNTRLLRTNSFIVSSALAGLAGSLYAYYINYIDPSSFSFSESVFILSIVVIGKPGSFRGTLLASIFLVLLPEPLRFIDIPPSVLGPMRQLLHALILFIVVWLNRERLFPMQRSI